MALVLLKFQGYLFNFILVYISCTKHLDLFWKIHIRAHQTSIISKNIISQDKPVPPGCK